MGSKQSKIEGTYLPDTPTIQQIKLNRLTTGQDHIDGFGIKQVDFDEADPRSPSGSRTPLNFAVLGSQFQRQPPIYQQHTPVHCNENTLGALRKRFLKGFTYSLNDPRSPSSDVNRTPIVYDENERTFNMDDTFADLFVDSRAMPEDFPEKIDMVTVNEQKEDIESNINAEHTEEPIEKGNDSSVEVVSIAFDEEETMPCPAALQQTPIIEQQEIDPRSPTYGVKRTPILFEDSEEGNEEEIIENILATLSLNRSNDSSIFSFGTPSGPEENNIEPPKPTNKHLERVRLGKTRIGQIKPRRSRRQQIYQDCENQENTPTTPKLKKIEGHGSATKRTPLSCVKNRSFARSRSVEISDKVLRTRLSLSSFDDNLNPVQNSKVINLRILQDSEDAMDL